MKIKRAVAMILTVALMMTLISSCNKEKKDKTNGGNEITATTIKLDNAYTEKKIPIDMGEDSRQNIVYSGDRIYFISTEMIEAPQDPESEDEDLARYPMYIGRKAAIVSADIDGGDQKTLWSSEMVYGGGEEIETHEDLRTFGVDSLGNVWTLMSKTTYDFTDPEYPEYTDVLTFTKISGEGEELLSVEVKGTEDLEYFYPQEMMFDKAGNIYTYDSNNILVFSGETGEFSFKVSEADYIYGVTASNEGDILYVVHSGENYTIKTIDPATKSAGGAKVYEGLMYFNNMFAGQGKYGFFFNQSDYIYGMDLETMTEEVVVNFLNSDIDGEYISKVFATADGEFIVSKQPWGDNISEDEKGVFRLTPNPEASTEGKALVTLGAMYLESNTRKAVQRFNKTSETSRIQVVDYSKYATRENYNQGMSQFDMDILGGNAPDIINLSGLNANKYMVKGVLEDLTEHLENDPDISKEDLFENILEAGSLDGKLYHIMPYFTIGSLVGKTSLFGSETGITMSEINAVAERFPQAELMADTSASSWLYTSLVASIDGFIDWEQGTCNFDNQEFMEILNAAKRFPAEIDYSHYDNENYMEYVKRQETMYKDDSVLLQQNSFSLLRAVRDIGKQFGEDITLLGFPSPNGGGTVIMPNADYGISATSQNKEAAWNFIKMFLGEEVFNDNTWSTSINKNLFEKKAAEEMTPIYERDFTNGIEIYEIMGNGMSMWTVSSPDELEPGEYDDYHLTQAEVDQVRQAIESANRTASYNEKILGIVSEEAEAFFNNVKSVEDTAQVIQSRVSIYVSENQ